MFHCTVGKDRTGLVAVLLCALGGVTDETVAQIRRRLRGDDVAVRSEVAVA